MKKRFLCSLLTLIIVFADFAPSFATVERQNSDTTASAVSAKITNGADIQPTANITTDLGYISNSFDADNASINNASPTDDLDLSDEDIAEAADLLAKLHRSLAATGVMPYEQRKEEVAAIMNADCTFYLDPETLNVYLNSGGYAPMLYQEVEDALRQMFPDTLKDVPSPLGIESGTNKVDSIINEVQSLVLLTDDIGLMPNFKKILEVLNRGPYELNVATNVKLQKDTTIKMAAQNAIVVDYDITANDGGEVLMDEVSIYVEHNRKKPTKLNISVAYSGLKFVYVPNKILTLKMSKSLQKKIMTGKVVLSINNAKRNKSVTEGYVCKKTSDTAGSIPVSFVFKKKSAEK